MKGFNRVGFLLVAAATALFLPACGGGGGGDGQDSYISLEQFKSGAKQYRIIGSVQMSIYADPGAIAYEGFDKAYEEYFKKKPSAGSGGYMTKGYVKFPNTRAVPANILYYVDGGEAGSAGMVVNFEDRISQDVQERLANFAGTLTPTDIQFEGLADTTLYTIPEELARTVLVSLQGARLQLEFTFSSQMCTGELVCATVSSEDGQPLEQKAIVKFTFPYVAEATGS